MITGSITALVTPFKDGRLDSKAYADFIEWQIQEGTNGLVPCGTTGETSTLGTSEHIEAIDICVKVSAGRVPVIAGIGSNNTASAAYMAREAQKSGADAVLAVAPYYNKPSQEGMYQHFKVVSQASDLKILIYNIPGRSVVDIDVDTMARISGLPNVYGVKDATSDISRVSDYKVACGEDFVQLSGDDPTSLAHWAHGGNGCISVTSNVAPAQCAAFHKACAAGDFVTARKLHQKLDGLFKDLFLCASPAPAKYALSLLGRMSEDVRLPIIPCRDSTKTAVQNALRRAGVEF